MQRGCRLLVVASRSGSLAADSLAVLAAGGCTVMAVPADSADAAAMARVLAWAQEELPHIEHFAHAAGVSGFALLQDMSLPDFRAVVDVKVRSGGWTGWKTPGSTGTLAPTQPAPLHRPCLPLCFLLQAATAAAFQQAALPLSSRLLFSSTSAVWSQSGSAHYAAANAFLDAHAAASQGGGLPSTAVQFGPFAGAGMAASHVDGLAALGLNSLQPEKVGLGGLVACGNCLRLNSLEG